MPVVQQIVCRNDWFWGSQHTVGMTSLTGIWIVWESFAGEPLLTFCPWHKSNFKNCLRKFLRWFWATLKSILVKSKPSESDTLNVVMCPPDRQNSYARSQIWPWRFLGRSLEPSAILSLPQQEIGDYLQSVSRLPQASLASNWKGSGIVIRGVFILNAY